MSSDEKEPDIPLPTREEMLAAELPYEWHGISRAGDQVFGKVVYRHATPDGHQKMMDALKRALQRK